MQNHFDTHDFIIELLKLNPVEYFSILRDNGERVFQTNAQISNHLKHNAEKYHIRFTGKHNSPDIYLVSSECATFVKNENGGV